MGILKTGLKAAGIAAVFGVGYMTAKANYTTEEWRVDTVATAPSISYRITGDTVPLHYTQGHIMCGDTQYVTKTLLLKMKEDGETGMRKTLETIMQGGS